MSDVSVLSHEYKAASDLSQRLNLAVIVLKKSLLDLAGDEDISDDDIVEIREGLASTLEAIMGMLSTEEEVPDQTEKSTEITGELVSELMTKHRGELEYFTEDLRTTVKKLRNRSAPLGHQELSIIDEIASAADAHASHIFRRLMRK